MFRWPLLRVDPGGSGEPVGQRGCGTEAQGVSEWRPVLAGSWLNSHAGSREVFCNRRCSCIQGFVARSWNSKSKQQTHAGGRKLFTQVPMVNFVFCFDPLESRAPVYTVACLYSYTGRFECILFLRKGCITKAFCHLKTRSFLSSCDQTIVQRNSSSSFCLVGKSVSVISSLQWYLCEDCIVTQHVGFFLDTVILVCAGNREQWIEGVTDKLRKLFICM